MKNLFEPAIPLILQAVSSYFDGLPVWEEFTIRGRLLYEKKALSTDEHPAQLCSAVFFIPADSREPKPGNRIKYNGILYDITLVETKKDISGKTAAYRCTCGFL